MAHSTDSWKGFIFSDQTGDMPVSLYELCCYKTSLLKIGTLQKSVVSLLLKSVKYDVTME